MAVTGDAAVVPEHVVSLLVATTATNPRRYDVPFEDYLLLDELPYPRPLIHGTAQKTAMNYVRAVRQVSAWTGVDLLDTEPTEDVLRQILRWRDDPSQGGKERLETQRQALRWWMWWSGYTDDTLPYFLRHSWSTERAVNKAKREGRMRTILRFFNLPGDIEFLLGARPFERKVRLAPRLGRTRERVWRMAVAKDKLFRHLVFAGLYTAPRGSSEFATLRVGMYRPTEGGILGWPQPKKGMKPRDVALPESMSFVWHSKVDPSFDYYLEHVRPLLAGTRERPGPDEPMYLNANGDPFTESGIRNFVSEGVELSLGKRLGPHALRRAGCTWYYHHGWDVEEIARLVDDQKDTVDASYINRAWVDKVGRVNERSRTRRPAAGLLRSDGRFEMPYAPLRKARRAAPPAENGTAAASAPGEGHAPAGI